MIWQDILKIRNEAPLVHNITNYVVMNTTANALLAIGASPVMAHAAEEVDEMTGLARALVINIGTLSSEWVKAMVMAGRKANELHIPIVMDPVGCGATSFRTATAQMLVSEVRPSIIRGNASEIGSLCRSTRGTKGVDSVSSPDDVADDAAALSRSAGCVVSISGPVDIIIQGDRRICVANGHPMMQRVTGMGCTASAITGAFAAVNPSPLMAAAHAMAVVGIAAEMAAEGAAGPGSLQVGILDALYRIEGSDITSRLNVRGLQ